MVVVNLIVLLHLAEMNIDLALSEGKVTLFQVFKLRFSNDFSCLYYFEWSKKLFHCNSGN